MENNRTFEISEKDFVRGNECFQIEKWLYVDRYMWKDYDLFSEGKLLCLLSLYKDLFFNNKWYVNLICGGTIQYHLLTEHNSFKEAKTEFEKKYQEYFSLISEEIYPEWFEENGFEKLKFNS